MPPGERVYIPSSALVEASHASSLNHTDYPKREHFQTTIKMHLHQTILATASLLCLVTAICPGFNYAIGNAIPKGTLQGSRVTRWNVYDDSCNIVDGLLATGNPCDDGIFSCSPPPILFVGYKNTFTGLEYACRQDPNSGRCGSDVISVCVSGII